MIWWISTVFVLKSFLLFNSWHPNLVCSKSGIRRPTLSTRHRHPAYQKGETRKTMNTWISKCPTQSCSFHTQHADITTALCWIMLAGKLSTPDGSNFNLPTCIRSNITCWYRSIHVSYQTVNHSRIEELFPAQPLPTIFGPVQV